MIAHYKGYQNLLQENEGLRIPLRPLNRRDSLYRRALRGLGRRMARWGQALPERYPAPTPSPSRRIHQTG